MKLFEIFATLGLEASDFEQGIQEAMDQTRSFTEETQKQLEAAQQKWDELFKALDERAKPQSTPKPQVPIPTPEETAPEIGRLRQFLLDQKDSIGDAVKGMLTFSAGQLLTDAIHGAVSAVKEFASESIAMASNLAEVQNVVDVTFGDGADTINAWAKAAKSSFGMSELKAKQYTGTIGAMLKSMGLADDEVVSMSTNLAGLTGDMASFYNLDYDMAFDKIRSGLAGEIEPLRQLGVNMSVANLEAYAMSKGITKAYDAMTQAEQATLRYNYLLDATADAQGDFARTSDSYANATKLLSENIDTLKAQIGEGLVDAITPVVNMINELFAGDAFQENMDSISDTLNDETAASNTKYGRVLYLIDALEEMQEKQGDAVTETEEYKAALEALQGVMPELAAYIDDSSGSLRVNTQELRKNAEAVHALEMYDAKKKAVKSYADAAAEANQKVSDLLGEVWIKQADVDGWKTTLTNTAAQIAKETGKTVEETQSLIDRALSEKNYAPGSALYDLLGSGMDWKTYEYYKTVISSIATAESELAKSNEELATAKENAAEAEQAAERSALALEHAEATTYAEAAANEKYKTATDAVTASVNDLNTALDKATAYRADAVANARKTVDGITGAFESAPEAVSKSLDDITDALALQQGYWANYAQDIRLAQARGIDADMLAALSDGSADSAGILHALVNASDEELGTVTAQYKSAEDARQAAAQGMADAKLAVDESFNDMRTQVDNLIDDLNRKDEARAAMLETGSGVTDAMDETISTLSQQVATFRGLYEQAFGLGGLTVPTINMAGITYTPPASNAKGLDYVPYDNYLTYLHKGETVLSRPNAEDYRSGTGQAPALDYDRMAAAIAASLSGAAVQMDGKQVGVLVAPIVGQQIERGAWAGRYSG